MINKLKNLQYLKLKFYIQVIYNHYNDYVELPLETPNLKCLSLEMPCSYSSPYEPYKAKLKKKFF